MRSLLIIVAIAAAQVGIYFWRLRPTEFEWGSLTGVALMTLTLVFWSAVLQIAWRDPSPASPRPISPEPGNKNWRPLNRLTIAGFFALLAIHASIVLFAWTTYDGQQQQNRLVDGIYRAVSNGRMAEMRGLAAHGCRFNDRIDTADPLIHTANQPEVAEYLVDHGSDVNARNGIAETPLIQSSRYKRSPDLIRALIRHGSEVNLIDRAEDSALDWAVRHGELETAQELLEAGANVNRLSPSTDRTPLDEAIFRGNEPMIELLKKAGATPSPDA